MLTEQEVVQLIRDTRKLADDLTHLARENVASPEQLQQLDEAQNILTNLRHQYPFWWHKATKQ